jgi:hypothetical protein
MAVIRVAPINMQGVALSAHPIHYICDTTAELPASGLKLGDTALAKDTNLFHKASSATTWTPMSPPTFATPTVALGTAAIAGSATTAIRSDATLAAFDATVPTTVAPGSTAAAGSVAFGARRDHTHAMAALTFTKTAAFSDATTVVPVTIPAWVAPFPCTVTSIKGYRVGGTGATVNAYRNTTGSPLRSANLSLTSANAWMDGGAVQNTAFNGTTDGLLIGVITVVGAVTQVSVLIGFTRP